MNAFKLVFLAKASCKVVLFRSAKILYRIHGNFRGSYISRITCQEDFRVLIFADDLPLNDYIALDYRNFRGLKVRGCKPNSKNREFYVP